MLENLKSMLSSETSMISALENAAEKIASDDEDIEDAILNNSNLISDGVENDPEIAKVVDMIPESKDSEIITDEEVRQMVESYIPETKLLENDINMFPDDDADELVDFGDEPDVGERTESFESFIDDDFNDLGVTLEDGIDELDEDIDTDDIDTDDIDTDDIDDEDIDADDGVFEGSCDDEIDINDGDELLEDDLIEDSLDD